jgi:hypothetical protein
MGRALQTLLGLIVAAGFAVAVLTPVAWGASTRGSCNHWSGVASDGASLGDRRARVKMHIYGQPPHLRARDVVTFKSRRARVCALYINVTNHNGVTRRTRVRINPRGGRSSSIAVPRGRFVYVWTVLWFRIA